jgi:type VI secretion system secreted protein VgrG
MSSLRERLAADRRFEFGSDACPGDTFAVVRMSGVEAISRPYRFELVLVSDDAAIDSARLVGAGAQLRILAPDDALRATPYAGMLAEFDQLHQAGGFTFYRAVLVPRLWQLSLYRNSEVYLNEQSIPDIVESLFAGARFGAGRDYVLKLTGAYRPHSYVCQYQETPLAFISRWLEREGIYYYFEQADGIERLVLLDDMVAQPAQALAVSYRPADELDVGLAPDAVQGLVCRSRMLPRKLVLQDYNHRRASVPLAVTAEVSSRGLGEEMLYGENFRNQEEGQRYAKIRAEELRCGGRVFSGEATAVGLRSGYFIDLSHHYRDDFNGRYLVTEITHEGSQAGALLEGLKTPFDDGERQATTSYRNSFVALPAAAQFRPARGTPKPRVAGTMSATVDAEGSGEYAELDAYGQYKVQIPFDRTEKGAAKGSAPVRMASPYAGSDHGMHFPLHKGAEVLLSFTDGDPDQPVIVGAVPNSDNPSVVDARNPRLSMIHTKGGNEIGFDDTKGKEALWLRSPYQDSALVIGAPRPALVQAAAAPAASAPATPGNIFQATKGGSDKVTFGVDNTMSFGSKNTLSVGTEASLAASFANKVTMGSSLSINFATDVKWNMNAVPFTELFKSVTIDDTDSVTLKKSFSSNALDTVTFTAGARAAAVDNLALTTELNVLRVAVLAYTGLNLAQSAVFGMAVNGSAGGKLTPGANDGRPADPSSPMVAGGFTGWPGIVTKFGTDAITNGVALLLIQQRAQNLAEKIKALKNLSRMSLSDQGIVQTFGDGDDEARLELNGQGMQAGSARFQVRARRLAEVEAGEWIGLRSPFIALGQPGAGAGPALVKIDESEKTVRMETSNSALELKDDTATLVADKISVGHGLVVPNPRVALLQVQEAAARQTVKAAELSEDKAFTRYDNATTEPAKTLASDAWHAELTVLRKAREQHQAIHARQGQCAASTAFVNGLAVDAAATALTHTGTSVTVRPTGVAIEYGTSALTVDAMGVVGDGQLIRLG